MHHFKLSQGSIIIKHPRLAVVYHWWIFRGKDDQKNQWDRKAKSNPLQMLTSTQHLSPQKSVCSEDQSCLQRPAWSLSTGLCKCVPKISDSMSNLKELCSGLPLDPLPPNRGRDPNVPHAPIRTPNLTAEEERVSKYIKNTVVLKRLCNSIVCNQDAL